MILVYIALIIMLLSGIFYAVSEIYGKFGSFIAGVFVSGLICFIALCSLNLIGLIITSHTHQNVHTHKIVTLNDGKGINGRVLGNMFVMAGYINDTQQFAYYIDNGNGSYTLEKRSAYMSTVWTDANQDTAHIDITDDVTSCKKTWWLVVCGDPMVSFAHADFHVPKDSIVQGFNLDAQ